MLLSPAQEVKSIAVSNVNNIRLIIGIFVNAKITVFVSEKKCNSQIIVNLLKRRLFIEIKL